MDDHEKAMKAAELYAKLAESARARFDSRRNLEWKVSIGLWTLFGGAAGVVLTARTWEPGWEEVGASLLLSVVVLSMYIGIWMPWVNETHRRDSETAYFWESGVQLILQQEFACHKNLPNYLEPPRDARDAPEDAGDSWPRMSDIDPGKVHGNSDKDRKICVGWHSAHTVQMLITIAFALVLVGSLASKCYRSVPGGRQIPEFLKSYMLGFGWVLVAAIAIGLGIAIALWIFTSLARKSEIWERLRQGNMPMAIVIAAIVIALAVVAVAIVRP